MKNIIKKQISLEDAKSRLPGVLYYIDQEDELIDEYSDKIKIHDISDIEINNEFINKVNDLSDDNE